MKLSNELSKRIKTFLFTTEMIYIISDILIKAIAFLTLPFFLSVMSTEDYGEFSLYQSYMSVMSLFYALGISKGIVRYYVEKKDEKKYLGTVVWLDIVIGIICSIFVVTEEYLFGQFQLGARKALVISIASICNCLCNLLLEDLRAQMKAFAYAICGLFISILSTGLGWLAVCNFSGNLGYVRYIASIIPLLLLALVTIIYIFKRDSIIFKADVARYLLIYAIPLIPYTLSTTIIAEVSKWVFAKVGFSEVGIYSFSINLSSIMYIIVLSLNRAYQPMLFTCLRDGIDPKPQLKKNLCIFFLMYYIFLIFLNLAIKIFGSQEYMATTYIAPIIVCGYGYFFIYSLVVNYYYYYKKNTIISMIAMLSAGVIAFLNYILIPPLGYIGAALASFISYVVMYYIGAWYLKTKLKIKIFSLQESVCLQMALVLPAFLKVYIESI